MKSLRFYFRLAAAFLSRHRKVIILGFILGVLSFLIIPKVSFLVSQRKETERIGLVGRYTLDNLPDEITKLISQGLTKIDTDGSTSPSLAKDWIIENDGRLYTFHLRDNLKWQDKTPFKAKDINYNFKDAQIKILDDKTIQFILNEPFSPFPTVVSKPIIKNNFVGTGDYEVKNINRSGQLVESISLQSLKVNEPNFLYRFYPTEGAAKTGLKLGEVDVLKNIIDPSGFENWKNIKVSLSRRINQYVAIFFNNSDPLFESREGKSLRQALAYAVPKEPDQERALTSISPSSWAFNKEVKPYDYNKEKAKQALDKISNGRDKEINFKLSTTPYLLEEAEKIKKAWEELGLKIEIQIIKSQEEETQALLAIQEIPPDPDQYSLWHSTQEGSNITHFNNPRIDKLLEEGRTTTDKEKRKKIYYDFQKFLAEELPAIFLYYPTTYEISRL